MSRTIDEKVVEMKFDNKQFENNVQTSLSTLDKLKQSLKLTGASKGLENVNAAAKSVDMSKLSESVGTVQAKFSAMEIVAVTAIANITNSAVNAGKRLVKSLSLDQVIGGWTKYEQKTASVQTIMNATGKSIDEVNQYLNKLMWFSDETSYGFTDMTSALGQLTSAGGDIDKLIPMITGIANATAYAGKGASEFSRAIYNLNQSYSSGSLKYMDWKSLELAGIASKELKQVFIDTGVAMGKIAEGEVTIANFGSTLQKQWADTSVMEAAFGKFAELSEEAYKMVQAGEVDTASEAIEKLSGKYSELGEKAFKSAQEAKSFTEAIEATKDAVSSGWMKTFEILFGNYEEAKVLWTDLANTLWDVFASGAEVRNELLSEWNELGGRDNVIDSFKNIFHALSSIVTPIKEAFREIFPPTTAERLNELSKSLKNFTAILKLGDKQSENLKTTFKGLFSILDIVRQALNAIWNVVKPLISGVVTLGDGILGITAGISKWLINLNNTIRQTDIFNKALGKFSDILVKIVEFIKTSVIVAVGIITRFVNGVKELAKAIKEKIEASPGFQDFLKFLERLHFYLTNVIDLAGKFRDAICKAFEAIANAINWNLITNVIEGFCKVFSFLWKIVKTVGSAIIKVLGSVGSKLSELLSSGDFNKIFDIINGGLIASILLGIKKFIGGLKEFGSTFENVRGILDSVRGCFEAYQQNIQAKTLLKIASAIAILAASIVVISMVDSEKLNKSLGAITVLFADLIGSMALLGKMSGGIKGAFKTVNSMIGMSVAVLILAAALKTVSSIKTEDMTKGLLGVFALSAIVVAAAKIMSSNTKKAMKGAVSLISFALAIKILASACKSLSTLSWDEMKKGLVGVGILMAEVSVFLNTAKFSKRAVGTATGMVIMAAAIKILASACSDFGKMKWSEIGKGLTAIAILLGEIAIFTKLTGNAKRVVSTGLAMVLLGSAMKILASAVKDFSDMKWEDLARGLVGMAGALAIMVVALKMIPKSAILTGPVIVVIAAGLLVLAKAMNCMGSMSWSEIGRGLVVLASSLAILAVSLTAMIASLPGAAALVVATAALAVLAPVLALLGAMSWESIAKGLVAIAGSFIIMGIAGAVLSPLVPVILALGGALALIGVGVLGVGLGLTAIGVGLTSLSAGLMAFAASGSATATIIVSTLSIIISGILGLFPTIIKAVWNGIKALLDLIIDSGETICKAVSVIIVSVVNALVEAIPVLIDGVLKLLDHALKAIVEYTPKIVKAVFDILESCLKGIADNIYRVVNAAIDVVIAFIDGISQKLPDVIQAGFNLLINFINGITNAINTNTPIIVEAIQNLILALINAAVTVLTGSVDLFKKIGETIMNSGFIRGIKDKVSDLITTVKDFVERMKETISGKIDDFKNIAKNLVGGFVQGIKEKISDAVNAVKELGEKALNGIKDFLGIHSPSRKFAEIGRYLDEGLAMGLDKYSGKVVNSTENVGMDAVNAMSNAISSVSDIINSDMDTEPTIRPVIDMSDIESGAKNINALFSRNQAMKVSARFNKSSAEDGIDSNGGNSNNGNVYQFTQNNYSPKALSRVDIYRQTKNQFSMMERMVKA